MTQPLADRFEERFPRQGGDSIFRFYRLDFPEGDSRSQSNFLSTAETEIRADAEKKANDHLKAIIGMERDMAKAEIRAQTLANVTKWVEIMIREHGEQYVGENILSFLAKENK